MTETNNISPIYIIGDTPTAYLLAVKLTLANENVYLINQQTTKDKEISISFYDNTAAGKAKVLLKTCSVMHDPARMVILSLSPENMKSGLTYFSPSKAANCPILSFCKTQDSLSIGNILKKSIIPAYLNDWSIFKDDTLTFSKSSQQILISIDEDHIFFDLIQKTIAKTMLDITFNPDDTQNFWTDFIPYAANNLFTLEYGPVLREISQRQNLRTAYNTILDELFSILPENIPIDKETIISNTYLIPMKHKPSLLQSIDCHQSHELLFIQDTLLKQPTYHREQFPFIMKIITENLKKLLSSVER